MRIVMRRPLAMRDGRELATQTLSVTSQQAGHRMEQP